MKLSQLLMERESLLQKMRLSNLAYAYAELSQVVARIDRARLQGFVSLQQPTPERPWPLLVATRRCCSKWPPSIRAPGRRCSGKSTTHWGNIYVSMKVGE